MTLEEDVSASAATPPKRKVLGRPIASFEFNDPETHVTSYLVIDSLMPGGGSAGGIRMHPSVTPHEVARLARTMTYKYGGVDVPCGGAKLGVVADPRSQGKQSILRGLAKLIAPLVIADVYRFGEDLGTTSDDVAMMYDLIGTNTLELGAQRAKRFGVNVELPSGVRAADLGGSGFADRVTGYAVTESLLETCAFLGRPLHELRISIQGFGTVGAEVARCVHALGGRVVCVADADGCLVRDGGLAVPELLEARLPLGVIDRRRIREDVERRSRDQWLDIPADVLVPAAIADTITMSEVDRVRASIIIEAANIPVAEDAEMALYRRGVVVIPDFVANAGAAGSYAMIWSGQTTPPRALRDIGARVRTMTLRTLERSRERGISPREAGQHEAIHNLLARGVVFNQGDG